MDNDKNTRSPASPQAGWKLVPVELSQEQLDRVLERASLEEFNGSGWLEVYRAVYREAVAAAPQPPAAAEGESLFARAAWMLETYEKHLYATHQPLEEHPYIPSIGEVAEELSALAAAPTSSRAQAAGVDPDSIITNEFAETIINGIGSGEWRNGELALDRMELAAVVKGAAIMAIHRAALAATPSDGPIQWTYGPNEFKDWCAHYFGPDADDDYLAKAVFNLPPMAQKFARSATQREAAPAGRGDAVLANRVRDLIADHLADNWPIIRYNLEEVEKKVRAINAGYLLEKADAAQSTKDE